MLTKEYISYRNIATILDIHPGDIVNVSSDILQLMCQCRENNETFDPNQFIDDLIDAVGPTGTLLFPTFNWSFCRGKTFHHKKTPSQVGGLGNTALKRDDFRRTKHPIYSFAVWGKDQTYLCNLDNHTSWGEDSPFGYLYRHAAKNLFIGLNYKDGLTSVHYPEEKLQVKYRYPKNFSALYTNESGETYPATYQMLVRNPDLCKATKIDKKLDDVLIKKNAYKKYLINDIYFGIVDLKIIGDIMLEDMKNNAELVYPILDVE